MEDRLKKMEREEIKDDQDQQTDKTVTVSLDVIPPGYLKAIIAVIGCVYIGMLIWATVVFVDFILTGGGGGEEEEEIIIGFDEEGNPIQVDEEGEPVLDEEGNTIPVEQEEEERRLTGLNVQSI